MTNRVLWLLSCYIGLSLALSLGSGNPQRQQQASLEATPHQAASSVVVGGGAASPGGRRLLYAADDVMSAVVGNYYRQQQQQRSHNKPKQPSSYNYYAGADLDDNELLELDDSRLLGDDDDLDDLLDGQRLTSVGTPSATNKQQHRYEFLGQQQQQQQQRRPTRPAPSRPPGKRTPGGGGGGGRGSARASQLVAPPKESQLPSSALANAGASVASQFMLRSARGNRQYDVPQIECPLSDDGMERFACPSPDRMGRYRCIDDHVICDGFFDCPNREDEDRQACMFYKTTKAHLDVLADALLRWARGR